MRFDDASIALKPRTTHHCLDLAFAFLGRYFKPIATLWLLLVVPMTAGVYWLTAQGLIHLGHVLLGLFVFSGVFGRVLTAGAAPSAFGERLRVRAVLKASVTSLVPLLLKGVLLRIVCGAGLLLFLSDNGWLYFGGVILCLPCGLLMLRTSFQAEKFSLSKLDGDLHDRQTEELIKANQSTLLGRSLTLMFTGLGLWVILFWGIDTAAGTFLGADVFSSRIARTLPPISSYDNPAEYMADWAEVKSSLLWNDPLILAVIVFTGMIAYTIVRLAWFFCYVDTRVRLDLWDMELIFQQEAARLERRGA